ncbi:MAG: SHOCT domain-containing protein, partial [Acidimicrobiia bacterium]
QSLIERAIRSGDLVIESAGETGQSRYADIPDPEGLQSLIYQQREARTVSLRRGGSSVSEELSGLAELRDRGVLSEEEFEAQKRRLLEG